MFCRLLQTKSQMQPNMILQAPNLIESRKINKKIIL